MEVELAQQPVALGRGDMEFLGSHLYTLVKGASCTKTIENDVCTV